MLGGTCEGMKCGNVRSVCEVWRGEGVKSGGVRV